MFIGVELVPDDSVISQRDYREWKSVGFAGSLAQRCGRKAEVLEFRAGLLIITRMVMRWREPGYISSVCSMVPVSDMSQQHVEAVLQVLMTVGEVTGLEQTARNALDTMAMLERSPLWYAVMSWLTRVRKGRQQQPWSVAAERLLIDRTANPVAEALWVRGLLAETVKASAAEEAALLECGSLDVTADHEFWNPALDSRARAALWGLLTSFDARTPRYSPLERVSAEQVQGWELVDALGYDSARIAAGMGERLLTLNALNQQGFGTEVAKGLRRFLDDPDWSTYELDLWLQGWGQFATGVSTAATYGPRQVYLMASWLIRESLRVGRHHAHGIGREPLSRMAPARQQQVRLAKERMWTLKPLIAMLRAMAEEDAETSAKRVAHS